MDLHLLMVALTLALEAGTLFLACGGCRILLLTFYLRFDRQLMQSYIEESEQYARRKIKQVVKDNLQLERKEAASKKRYLATVKKRGRISDPAVDSLHAIIAGRSDGEKIYMERVVPPQPYISWVPLASNLDTGSYLDVDHNFPDYLSGNHLFKNAVANYREYLRKQGKHRTLELFDQARSVDVSDCQPLGKIRIKEGISSAVIQMLASVPDYEAATEYRFAMCRALGIRGPALRVIENEKKDRDVKTKRRRNKVEAISASKGPFREDKPPEIDELANEVAGHFCFSCFMFSCEEHEDKFHVKPALPIRDLYVEKRMEELQNPDHIPCSESCWSAKETPLNAREQESWTAEELGTLREMTGIFRFDPCSLSVVVGTRTCREIFLKLIEPHENYLMQRAIEKHGSSEGELSPVSSYRDLDDDNDEGARDEYNDFVPCNHHGPCSDENDCRCYRLGKWCEKSCSCNNTRFCEGAKGQGIAEFVDRTHKHNSLHGKCHNIHDDSAGKGCTCHPENCGDREVCPCRASDLPCTPGICACTKSQETCNPLVTKRCNCKPTNHNNSCSTVPCNNIPFNSMKRKRTLLGHSKVHGYGLFAAEYIEKGQFVGLYIGQLVDTNVAELLGFAYDEQGHTFLFDLTNHTVSDGTYLGSKMKFINHGRGVKEGENLETRKQFHRGNIHLGMFAKRDIKPGDELRFDYKFHQSIPDWMGGNKVSSKTKKPRRWATKATSKT